MSEELRTSLLKAIDARFDEQVAFTGELSSYASTRGNEQGAQALVAQTFKARGLEVDSWAIDIDDISHLPGFSPVIGNYDDAINVVGTSHCRNQTGKSLILNGHVDVVPEGPLDMWDRPPYEPHCEDGWRTLMLVWPSCF